MRRILSLVLFGVVAGAVALLGVSLSASAAPTVTANSAGSKQVGQVTNAWGSVGESGTRTVWTEVLVGDRWSRSQQATTAANGSYVLELTYGFGSVGSYRYRVGAATSAGTVYSAEFTLTRTPWRVGSAGTRQVGITTNTWGTQPRAAGRSAWTEVFLSGRWYRSQTRTASSSGYIVIPLTYGSNAVGRYTYRVVAATDRGRVYSEAFTLTRTARVDAYSAGSKQVGLVTNTWGTVRGYGGGQVSTQVLLNGRWSTSQTRTASSSGGFVIPLTYGSHAPGTYTFRVAAHTPVGTAYSSSFTLRRTGSTPPVISDGNYDMRRGPNVTNRVVLSFDDCPTSLSSFRSTVLAAEAADIGLALFPTGDCIRAGRFDAAFARAHGHHVFNHSVTHPNLTTLSYEGVRRELSAPGVVTSYGRPPYGAYNSTVLSAYRSKGMRPWLWNVDTSDWRGRSQAQVVNVVTTQTGPGQSVLMHMQWHGFNGTALNQMKSGLNNRGIGVCRNYQGTVPVSPSGMWC